MTGMIQGKSISFMDDFKDLYGPTAASNLSYMKIGDKSDAHCRYYRGDIYGLIFHCINASHMDTVDIPHDGNFVNGNASVRKCMIWNPEEVYSHGSLAIPL
jgi:hypothetical protein